MPEGGGGEAPPAVLTRPGAVLRRESAEHQNDHAAGRQDQLRQRRAWIGVKVSSVLSFRRRVFARRAAIVPGPPSARRQVPDTATEGALGAATPIVDEVLNGRPGDVEHAARLNAEPHGRGDQRRDGRGSRAD